MTNKNTDKKLKLRLFFLQRIMRDRMATNYFFDSMKKTCVIVLPALLLLLFCGSAVQLEKFPAFERKEKLLVGVIPFENKTGEVLPAAFSNKISGALISNLQETGRYRVLERERIADVLKEHSLGQSGVLSSENTEKIGKMLGVDALVIGSVSAVRHRRGKATIILFWVEKQQAEISVDARVVDVTTGEVLVSAETSVTKTEREWVAFWFARLGGIQKTADLILQAMEDAAVMLANQLGQKAVRK